MENRKSIIAPAISAKQAKYFYDCLLKRKRNFNSKLKIKDTIDNRLYFKSNKKEQVVKI